MRSEKVFAVLVVSFVMIVGSARIVQGAQYLTVSGQDVSSITLELGQSRTVEIVSTDGTSYVDYAGFDNGLVLGAFSYLETRKEAGNLATAIEYNQPTFYGYYVNATGISPPPSAGVHFIFKYTAQQVGETDLKLYDSTLTSVIDLVHITVMPLQAVPMGTAWTYQGRLIDSNSPADGFYDFQFKLYNNPNPFYAEQQGSTIDINDLDVIDGYFTVELDFGGGVFDGDAVWLEISVRPGDSNDSFTTLSLRQELTPSPYSRYAAVAGSTVGGIEGSGTADNLAKFTGPSTVGNSVIYEVDDKIGIGTQDTQAKLSVQMPSGPPLSIIDVDGLVIRDGWWNNGDHLVVQDVAGNPQLVIRGPRIGIGTASPEVGLHLKGPGWPNSFVYLQGDTGYDAGIRLYEGNIDKWHIFNSTSDDGLRIYNSNGSQTVFFADQNTGNVGVGTTNPVNKLDVEGGLAVGANYSGNSAAPADGMIVEGSIGIGTDSPDEKLHVKGSDFVQANFESDSSSGGIKLTASGGQAHELQSLDDGGFIIYDRTDEKYRVTIDTTGNVGIGTKNPLEKLHVDGNIYVSSNEIRNYFGFPRPDWDSNWQPIDQNQAITLTHNLGSIVGQYVVDMQCKGDTTGINNIGYGGDHSGSSMDGAYWRDLTTSQITIQREANNLSAGWVRIRIWIYKIY